MIYVLFQYKEGPQKRGYHWCNSFPEVEEFLSKNISDFLSFKIIEVKKEYTAKWVFTPVDVKEPKKEAKAPQKEEIKPTRKRGRPKKVGKLLPEYQALLNKEESQPDKEASSKIEVESAEESAEAPEESSEIATEEEGPREEVFPRGIKALEEGNDIKDEHKEDGWQLETMIDSKGRKKRKCWNPNCRKWFVIKYKGQRYHQDDCRHKHQKRAEAV